MIRLEVSLLWENVFGRPHFVKNKCYVKNCFLRVIPTLTHYSDIVSDILSGSMFIWHINSDVLSDILSGILSGIYSDILSGICIWHIF